MPGMANICIENVGTNAGTATKNLTIYSKAKKKNTDI